MSFEFLIIFNLEPFLFPLHSAAVIVPNSPQLDGTNTEPGSVSALEVSTLQYQEALLELETAYVQNPSLIPHLQILCHRATFQNTVFLTVYMWFVP